MPKRQRDEETKDVHVESSLESGRKFEAYIRGWVRETTEPQVVRPSSLPPLMPLPALICSPTDALRSTIAAALVAPTPVIVDSVSASVSHITTAAAAAASHAGPTSGTAVVYDDCMLEHTSPDPSDYERPARLSTTLDHLAAVGLLACCRRIPARTAKTKELRRVHSRELVDTIDQLDFFMGIRDEKSGVIGQDLFASEHTSRAARMAAGCVIEAAKAVVSGVSTNAFALIRPPGHHAGPGNASGFCLYNNVAVAARAAQEEMIARRRGRDSGASGGIAKAADCPRILILDWDVHHCDGTESVFYDDPSVLVISIHQYGSGRGHVLRKMPSTELTPKPPLAADSTTSTSKEDIDVNELAVLLASSEQDEDVPQKDTGATEAQQVTAVPQTVAEAMRPPPPPPFEAAESRRPRKQVDYNKLAAELQDDGADDIAALFGVDVKAAASSSSSTSSSSSASVGDAASSTAANDGQRKKAHYAGDTVGLSFDETPPLGAPREAEEPFYPGTGHITRVGGETVEKATGRNINIPWPTHEMGDLEYVQVMHDLVLPAAREFEPELVFISSGFDSAHGDLLGSMSLSPSGFYIMTRLMATNFPKLVVALEGGYNVKNVALGSEAVMRALLESSGNPVDQLPRTRMLWFQAAALVAEVKKMHAPYWKCFSDP
ncbi:putative histone deacetylase [Leptomonas pyrrhocoris]|uniref:Putative histone deacetylase n=1 Tax=Leptomonas pyrrhocoris TaxID=157538 RepID=A0A0M9FY14_LEPPY|nr:putative histone deacetylase [Leptomonas pyrrhocoris]KPA78425.1 putative histone deacetylase [Leptomonas pyrrhocoris]|eukprot:XP_015656864.1 putative histone deacetylase [Leptomonas pyrrhocoris]